jgi:diguanylate cyclase (GGDEF)-like protein/PAS domain S-box-containing protein
MLPLERAAAVVRDLQSAMTSIGPDPLAVCRVAVAHAVRALSQAEGATLELLEGDGLLYHAAQGMAAGAMGRRTSLYSSLSGLCVRTNSSQLCRDCQNDDRVDVDACIRLGVHSALAVPLPIGDKTIGVLKLVSPRLADFDEHDVALAELLVAPLAYGLSAARAHRNEQMFVATFEQAAVGICHVAVGGGLLRVNRRFCEIAGHPEEALLAGGFQQITHPDDLEADLSLYNQLLRGEIESYSLEKRYIPQRGDPVWVNLTVSLVRHPDGRPDFFVAVAEDIAERRKAQELAMYDPLTGLPNRRHLLRRLDALLEAQSEATEPACVVFVDLDRFKSVNDLFGHAEGDRCLAAIAEMMRERLRRTDFVGRLSGDEFVLLMTGCSEEAARHMLHRIGEALEQLAESNGWPIGFSAGAIMLPPAAFVGSGAVLAAADAWMYAAKRTEADSQISFGWLGDLPEGSAAPPARAPLPIWPEQDRRGIAMPPQA